MFVFFYRRTPESRSMVGHGIDAVAVVVGLLALGSAVEGLGAPKGVVGAIVLAFAVCYPVIPLRYLGGTLGQRLFGVRVVTTEGAPLQWSHVLKRLAGQLLEMALMVVTGPFGFVGLMIHKSRNQQRWLHDSIAGTRVIWSSDVGQPLPPPPLPASPEQRRLRVRLIATVAVVMVALFASTLSFERFFMKGTLHVVAPNSEAVRVRVDAQPEVVLPAGEHAAFELSRGEHTVVLERDGVETTRSLEVSGGQWAALVRSSPEQCFLRSYVSRSHFLDGCKYLPRVEARYADDYVEFAWPNDQVVFTYGELPAGLRSHASFVEQVPCSALRLSDEELLRDVLGYEGSTWSATGGEPETSVAERVE